MHPLWFMGAGRKVSNSLPRGPKDARTPLGSPDVLRTKPIQLRGIADRIYRIDRMTANFSRFWFTYRTWRTGAGSAD